MRKRLNRVAVASSSNYSSSRRAHIDYLTEQHNNNSVALLAITSKPRAIDDLQQFELHIQQEIKSFRERRQAWKLWRISSKNISLKSMLNSKDYSKER